MISINSETIKDYLTPYKYPHPVLAGSGAAGSFDEQAVDIPFVFRHHDEWRMMYVGFDGTGYQTAMAKSDDLLHWKSMGVILPRRKDSKKWDSIGQAGTWIIKESDNFNDTPRIKKIDGKYWMVYHSYPGSGYEDGPAQIGLAYCTDENLMDWTTLDKPVYSYKDGADWECGGLYKACIITHEGRYVMFYNAKTAQTPWFEETGIAYSDDLLNWTREAMNPVLKVDEGRWDRRFVSDPYILKDKDKWLNFFFGLGPGHAQEGLAVSYDLINWEKVDEPIIKHGDIGDLDSGHAHKASIVMHEGRLYHFYCATRPWAEGDRTKIYQEFRTIAVASNHPFTEQETNL